MDTVTPFRYEEPLEPGDLIDRELELTTLLDRAAAGRNTRLVAPRRFGKTSLLGKLLVDLRAAGGAGVLVDLYGVVTIGDVTARIDVAYERALEGPLRRWWQAVRRTLHPSVGMAGARVDVEPSRSPDTARALLDRLDLPRQLRERTGMPVCVVFDEFQAILGADDRLDGTLRSQIQHHPDVGYVFSGSHPGMMRKLFADRRRPLYDQAAPLELGLLSPGPLAEAIGWRFEESGRDAGVALGHLLELADGHPQRAMQLAAQLWLATPPGAHAGVEEWDCAMHAALHEESPAFETRWESLSDHARRALRAVAVGLSPLSAEAGRRYSTTKGSTPSSVRTLLGDGDLMADPGKPGGVRVTDPLFAAWLRGLESR
jgi:hypothetical protein